jgi:DNA-binding CsgD family transcriptional regulator
MSQELNAIIIDDAAIITEGLEVILNRHFFPLSLTKMSSFPSNLDKLIKAKVDILFVNSHLLWQYNGDLQHLTDSIKAKNISIVGYNIQNKGQTKLFSTTFSLDEKEEQFSDKIKSLISKTNKFTEEESSNLSTREIEVIREIINGNSNKEIAEKLFISTHTVITHRKNITHKLGIKSISGLTIYAILHGLVEIDQYKQKAQE